jgi:hypothetical protein
MNRTEVEEPFEGLLDQVTIRLRLEFNSDMGRVCVKAGQWVHPADRRKEEEEGS